MEYCKYIIWILLAIHGMVVQKIEERWQSWYWGVVDVSQAVLKNKADFFIHYLKVTLLTTPLLFLLQTILRSHVRAAHFSRPPFSNLTWRPRLRKNPEHASMHMKTEQGSYHRRLKHQTSNRITFWQHNRLCWTLLCLLKIGNDNMFLLIVLSTRYFQINREG